MIRAMGIKLDRGLLMLVTDEDYILGSVVVATPTPAVGGRGITTPAHSVVGSRSELAARVIATRTAQRANTTTLVMVSLTSQDRVRVQQALETAEKVLNELYGT